MTTRVTFGLAALAGLSLALGGCGGGGGGSSSGTKVAFVGDGKEVYGYYVAEITSSSGIYATNHYAIPGFTQHVYIDQTLGVVDFAGISLTADLATKTYVGVNTYSFTDGALDTNSVTEDVTMSFSGGVVYLTVKGTSGTATGSFKVKLHAIHSADQFDQDGNYYYGRNTSFSGGPSKIYSGYKGESNALELENWGPGTYAYVYWDATYNWNEYPYIDAMYLDGNTLKGGGYYDGSYITDGNGDIGDAPGGFVSLSVPLNSLGQPSAASWVYSDYEAAVTVKGTADGFQSENKMDLQSSGSLGITVLTVTGPVLTTEFGPVSAVPLPLRIQNYGYYLRLTGQANVYGYGGYVSPTQRRFEFWEGRSYEYDGGAAGYEYDGVATTPERIVWTINTTAAGVPTGGTVDLTIYDATFNVTSTEQLTFSVP